MTEKYDIETIDSWDGESKEAQKIVKYYKKHGEFKFINDVVNIEDVIFKKIGFKETKRFDIRSWLHVLVDEKNKKYYVTPRRRKANIKIYDIEDIESVEICEDEYGDRGKNAAIGAMWLGATGAVVGASKKQINISVKLNTSDAEEPIIDIFTTPTPINPGGREYANAIDMARKIYGYFKSEAEKNRDAKDKNKDNTDEAIEKIRQLKNLYDEGILTLEEFEAKKKQILDI